MRKAEVTDIEDLYEIYSDESVAPNMGFDPCSRQEFDEIYLELISGGELIVEEGSMGIEVVCKVIRRTRRLNHSVYIGSLAVNPKFQGKGIGKKFFSELLSKLKGEGYTRIELLVASDNQRALSFFRSFGFEIEGTLRNYFSRAGSEKLFNENIMAWVPNT
ncbi:GNAT family N-acetyltransferase [Spartinivicinus ruber]|uniref:GNAT family N-acetyltransferase n=1 Tax=Spartinivicinus ruber TaxID=2683272 RepID=UPI0013D34BF1|nr:N-acetyltransferase [Spartinivicinus ruber]